MIILNRFVIGGQAVDTIPLAYHLQSHFDILILYGEKEADEIEPSFLLEKYPGLQLKKIRQLRRSVNPFVDLVAFIQLFSAIRNFRPQIVHTHGAKSGFLGRIAAFVCRTPVIVHTFHGHFFHSYFSPFVSQAIAGLERLIGRITTRAVALSETQKAELVGRFHILPEQKVQIIPLGFDMMEPPNAIELRKTFRARYGLDENVVAIGIVGRIVPIKNHELFLEVARRILQSNEVPNAAFLVIGDGDVRRQLEDWLTAHNMLFSTDRIDKATRVLFTSWLTDVEEIMSGLDIIALTSRNEGTPLTLIEAQFFEKPVVCTDVGGVKDTMCDGVTGFLVPPDDPGRFVEKLSAIANDISLRQKMGAAGKSMVQQSFDKQKEVMATVAFYERLIAEKQR